MINSLDEKKKYLAYLKQINKKLVKWEAFIIIIYIQFI